MRLNPWGPPRRWFAALVVACAALASGCKATCQEVCAKLVECDGLPTERMSADECEESCKAEADLYDGWADIQKQDAFQAELDCLSGATCEDIAAGVCYDDSIWSF